MRVRIAKVSGFCFGVQRALNLANEITKKGPSESLGPIIHNLEVVQKLKEKGLRTILSLKEGKTKNVVIRAHGVPPQIYKQARELEITLYDGTCPYVRMVQKLAEKLHKEKYTVVIIGKKDHPEIKGVLGYTDNKGIVISEPAELCKFNFKKQKVGIVVQTTYRFDIFSEIVNKIMAQAVETRVYNTRCYDTDDRQKAVINLAKEVEVMVIVGGKDSSNTRKLFELSEKHSAKAYHIETPDELKRKYFENVKEVGVAGGASTPPDIVEEVKEKIISFSK